MSQTIRLALIGTGAWAKSAHLPALEKIRSDPASGVQLTLRGIYGIDPEQVVALAQQYRFQRRYASLDELLGDDELDAVAVVIAPAATRAVVTQIHQHSKLYILTEKPPGADYAQAVELASQITDRHLVAFNRRYKDLNNQFRTWVAGLTDITTIDAAMCRNNRCEDHFILHTGIHLINYLEYLFGPIAEASICRDSDDKLPQYALADFSTASELMFTTGMRGRLIFSPRSGEMWEGLTVCADDDVYSIRCPLENDPGQIMRTRRGVTEIIDGSSATPRIVRDGFVAEYLELFAMIRGHPARSTFQTSANCMGIAEKIESFPVRHAPGGKPD